jgi:hypothetical protein
MPDRDYFSSSTGGMQLPLAFEAVLAAHAQREEAVAQSEKAAAAMLATAQQEATKAQAAVARFTGALSRITYSPDAPLAIEFVSEMEAATAALPTALPGGATAAEVLGGFLCDVEADRQARATLEAQLRTESARAEDAQASAEVLQVGTDVRNEHHLQNTHAPIANTFTPTRTTGSSRRAFSPTYYS